MPLVAMNWRGQQVNPKSLLDRYQARIRPLPPGTAGMRVQAITEVFGRNSIQISVPLGYLVRMIIPNEDRNHSTERGVFTNVMNAEHHTYFPKNGSRGPFGFEVAGVPSEYIDGLGIAYGQYDGELDQAPDGVIFANNYGHLDVSFGWEAPGPIAQPAPIGAPTPTPPPATANTLIAVPIDFLREIKRHMANAQSIDAEITRLLNQRPN